MDSRPNSDIQHGRRSWDDVIPGLDAKTKKMYEDWDEVVYCEKEEPLCSLLERSLPAESPLQLVQPDQISSAEDAKKLLDELLDRLADYNVIIIICDHFSDLDTYRWLVEELIPEAQIHPELPRMGWFEHYPTSYVCPQCAEESGD